MRRTYSCSSVKIYLESNHLIMRGSPSDSAGCVLRGVLVLSLKKRTRIKSIVLRLLGRMSVDWSQSTGNGHEKHFQDERVVISHTWTFLSSRLKPHYMGPGTYPFDFELPLSGSLPESVRMDRYYSVQYQLTADVRRISFLPKYSSTQTLHISRQLHSTLGPELLEPIMISKLWADKLDYTITVPTRLYTYGDQIPITVRVVPLKPGLRVRHLSCTFKEYMICSAVNGWFGGKPQSHGRILGYINDREFGTTDTCSYPAVWSTTLLVDVPDSPEEVQCNVHNETVQIRHKIKFVLSVENPDGHLSELRAVFPITIHAANQTGLPAYDETWNSFPYDPALMTALLRQAHVEDGDTNRSRLDHEMTQRSIYQDTFILPPYSAIMVTDGPCT